MEGTAGGDLVKVVLRGDYEMKSILVTEKAKNEKREIINDLIDLKNFVILNKLRFYQ